MRYNDINEEKEKKEKYLSELSEDVDKLEYLVNAPLDDAYKIRIARERLGMCFPDEIIFHTEMQ
jgi:cell division protein FtsB